MPTYSIETVSESGGHCDCCGNSSRSISGIVYQGEKTVAAYWLHWTVGHLDEPGANLDLALGSWGDGTSAGDRVAISLVHREQTPGNPELMVIDAHKRPVARSDLVAKALSRLEVIGTPLAPHVFEIVDAIYEQDARFF